MEDCEKNLFQQISFRVDLSSSRSKALRHKTQIGRFH